jgi:hypothetical protein
MIPSSLVFLGVLKLSSAQEALKVFTNEKRGGLKVVRFDRSPFMLFTLRFSKKIGAGPIL